MGREEREMKRRATPSCGGFLSLTRLCSHSGLCVFCACAKLGSAFQKLLLIASSAKCLIDANPIRSEMKEWKRARERTCVFALRQKE